MIIIFNPLGLLWLIAAFGVAIGLQRADILINKQGKYFLEVLAFSILFFDLVFRFFIGKNRKNDQEAESQGMNTDVLKHWLLGPNCGGSLMFLPAWSTAVLAYFFLTYVVLS